MKIIHIYIFVYICIFSYMLFCCNSVSWACNPLPLRVVWPFIFWVNPLTVTISLIQGGFEDDTRKMCENITYKPKWSNVITGSPPFWWLPLENIKKISLLLCPPSPSLSTPSPPWQKLWAGLPLQILWAIAAVSMFCPPHLCRGIFQGDYLWVSRSLKEAVFLICGVTTFCLAC